MNVKELMKKLDIDGLTDQVKDQMEFLNALCLDVDFTDEQRKEIESNMDIVKNSFPKKPAK